MSGGSNDTTPMSERQSGANRNRDSQAVELLHTDTATFERERSSERPFQPKPAPQPEPRRPGPAQPQPAPVAAQMGASLNGNEEVTERKLVEKIIPIKLLMSALEVPLEKSDFVGSGNVTSLVWKEDPHILEQLFTYEGEDGTVIVPRSDNFLLKEMCLEMTNTSPVALAVNGSHFQNQFKHVTEMNQCETHATIIYPGEKKKQRVFYNEKIKDVAQHSSFPLKKELELMEHHLSGCYNEFRVNAENPVLDHIARVDEDGHYIDSRKVEEIRQFRNPANENGTVRIDKKMYYEMRQKLLDAADKARKYYTDISNLMIDFTRMDGRKYATPPAEFDLIGDEERGDAMKAFATQVSALNGRLYVQYYIDP